MKVEKQYKAGEQTTRLQMMAELMRLFPDDLFEIRQKDEMTGSILKNEVSYLKRDCTIKFELTIKE